MFVTLDANAGTVPATGIYHSVLPHPSCAPGLEFRADFPQSADGRRRQLLYRDPPFDCAPVNPRISKQREWNP